MAPQGDGRTQARLERAEVAGRPVGAEPNAHPHVAAAAWELGAPAAAGGRPTTPAYGSAVPGRHTATRHMQHEQQQQRTASPGGHTTPMVTRAGAGLLRAVRTSSNSLTGLLKRPATAAAGSPGSPLFEVRGAGLVAPEPPRPATAGAANSAAGHVHGKPAAAAPPASYNIQARAGQRAAAHTGATSSHASPQRAQPAVVAAHGLDLGSSPVPAAAAPAPAAGQQQQLPQQRQQQPAGSGYSMPPAVAQSASPRASEYGAPGGSSGASGARAGTVVHSNPLYSSGSEAYARPRSAAIRHAQQPYVPRMPPPVRTSPSGTAAAAAGAGAAAAASAAGSPFTPQAGLPPSMSTGTTPGASPLAGTLQAASNITITSDRPISPGLFPSTFVSGALPESASRSQSRPVSPQCMDSAPPTPGSFAPLGAVAAAAARAGSNLSPVKTAAAAAAQSRSLPTSPAPPAELSSAGASGAALPPGGAATAYRLPIFNQDGRLVGYKQNSNVIPRPGACISSAPSSPTRSALSTGDTFAPGASSSDGASPTAAAKVAAAPAPQPQPPTPPSPGSEFAEQLADPCRGFPDVDNVVPGYVLGPVLGKGGFCSVRKALHQLTGQIVACKIIEKGKLKDPKDRDRVDRECRVMRNLSNHVGVVKLYECCETRDYVYILMEAAKRGSLLDYVRERKKLPEEEATTILQQLLHSLQFCHRKDVVHRDIKLENILIDSAGHMKLIDFGLCGYYVAGKRLRCHCGSPSYAAPEIVARKDYLGPPVDVWSLGVVLFATLAGYLPFHAKEKKALSEKILSGVYKPAAWMSPEAQDLLSRMLTLDPDQRITLEGVWTHPWVARAPRWEPPGVGVGRLYRALTDPTTGAVLPDDAVLAQLESLGADVAAVRRALRSRECNSLTAAYHLVFEAGAEAQRAAAAALPRSYAAVNSAAAAAAPQPVARKAAQPGDWAWDFAAITANTAAGPAPGAASGMSTTSAGSSSLRNSSPGRPRTAASAGPAGSPTRFGQEAAAAVAAGYMASPGRPATGAMGSPASPLQLAAASARQHAATAAAAALEWDIKAVHVEAAGAPGATAGPAGAAAPPQVPPLILTTVVADGGKSPCLSPLPTALSPKQLQLVPGGGGGAPAASHGDQSPPIAQAV